MVINQAIRLAVQAITSQIQALAVHANLYKQYGIDTPTCMQAHKHREELREAIKTLNQIKEEIRNGKGS